MDSIKTKYEKLCNETSDVNEHLPTLYNYAKECESVLELGAGNMISSYALIYGLLNNSQNTNKRHILLNDINECNISCIMDDVVDLNINIEHAWVNDLDLPVRKNYDLTVVDTWRVYGQIKRELQYFSTVTNKYIIILGTSIDSLRGETMRRKINLEDTAKNSCYSVGEVKKGLLPAIVEFINENNGWKFKEQFPNTCGLTVLEKE